MSKETRTDWTIWLKQQQRIVINFLSRFILILGLIGLLFSLARLIDEPGLTFNIGYYTVSLVLLLILFYVRKIPDLWRSLGFLFLLYAFGTLSMYSGWLASGGRGFLLALIVVSAVLMNPRIGLYVAGIVLTTYILFGLAFSNGWLNLRPLPNPTSVGPILTEGVGFAMNILLVAGGLWFFGKALMAADRATRQAQEAYGSLDAKTRELEIAKDLIARQSEMALMYSEEKFHNVIAQATDGILISDEQGIITDWNKAAERITGIPKSKAVGRHYWDLQNMLVSEEPGLETGMIIPGETTPAASPTGDAPWINQSLDYQIQCPDGTRRFIQKVTFPIQTEKGCMVGSILHDITDRKQAEDILFEEKERAEVTLHSIGDAVITTGIDSIVEYLNPVAENLTGWKMEEAVGKPLVDVFKILEEDSNYPAVNPVTRCLQEGRIYAVPPHTILVRRDGMQFSISDTAAPIRNHRNEIVGIVLVFHDVTEERRLTQQVAHDAMHDSLTGLVNRREFEKRLERALTSARERGLSHIFCYLDLDQFKIVNDSAGHAAGDELLKQFAGLMRGAFRKRDTFARLGGDEFGLLLENCNMEQAMIICHEILTKTRGYTFVWEKSNFQVGVSIGVVPITAEKESATQLLSQADIACYSAKDLGRNRVYVYHSGDSDTVQRHTEIMQAARMRDAIFNDQFLLYCQPIAVLKDNRSEFNHYEILLRMTDEEKNPVLPNAFIPSAERYGLMGEIDRWVIRRTLFTMSQHDMQGVQININLSGNSLDDEHLLEYVLGQLHEFSIPPEQICFEITETAAIQHLNQARQFAQAFRQQGGRIALDDFGSGFSSFRYLKTLPVDCIKIDGSFVSGLLSNPTDQVTVEAITRIAHALGIQVAAEFATDTETIDRLREIGVEIAQGFGIGYPVPVEEVWRRKASPIPE